MGVEFVMVALVVSMGSMMNVAFCEQEVRAAKAAWCKKCICFNEGSIQRMGSGAKLSQDDVLRSNKISLNFIDHRPLFIKLLLKNCLKF